MARVADGDAAALHILVERHLPRAHAIAQRVLVAEADAQDAVQEAFAKLWVNASSWRAGRAAFTTWLYRIVVNTCLDAARRRRPEVDSEAIITGTADPAPSAEAQLEAERVRTAVHRLPAQQRTAVTLCYFEGFTNPEAAAIMNLHLKALEGLLVRARKTLRSALAPTED